MLHFNKNSCITNSLAPDDQASSPPVIAAPPPTTKIERGFSGFEGLHPKFNTRKSSLIVSSIYRPPVPITSSIIIEFEELVNFISSQSIPFSMWGDFNAPDMGTKIHRLLEETMKSRGLVQHSLLPNFHGHTLDLLIKSSSHSFLSNIIMNEVTYSGHHFISCNISAETISQIHSSQSPRKH